MTSAGLQQRIIAAGKRGCPSRSARDDRAAELVALAAACEALRIAMTELEFDDCRRVSVVRLSTLVKLEQILSGATDAP